MPIKPTRIGTKMVTSGVGLMIVTQYQHLNKVSSWCVKLAPRFETVATLSSITTCDLLRVGVTRHKLLSVKISQSEA